MYIFSRQTHNGSAVAEESLEDKFAQSKPTNHVTC